MTAIARSLRPSLRDLLRRFAPAPTPRHDPLGLSGGWRAYRVYRTLEARSDVELAALGLSRTDIARVAFESIRSAEA